MKEAVVSDIHANIEALERVLVDINNKGINRIICLGDVIGYGASPAQCLDLAMKFDVCLVGNHEWAVMNQPVGFNRAARKAVEFTRSKLKHGFLSGSKAKKRWEFLKNLPEKHKEGNYLFVHGSPTSPIEEYILRQDVDEVLGDWTKKIELAFENTEFVAMIGHTHSPGILSSDARFITPGETGWKYTFEEGKKYLVNVGSVGQPRDRDPRACYAVLDRENHTVEYFRIEYNVNLAMKKIHDTEFMDEQLAERLKGGT